jgi:hypothetical protein
MIVQENVSTGIVSKAIELSVAELEVLSMVNGRVKEVLKDINFENDKSIYYSFKDLSFAKRSGVIEDLKLLSSFTNKLTAGIKSNKELFDGLFGEDDKDVNYTIE